MTGALAGLRVVEIAGDIAGPYCTKLLADLGAEVTKIEPPTGDPLREWGPFPGGVKDPDRSGHVRIPQRREARRDNRSRRPDISASARSPHRCGRPPCRRDAARGAGPDRTSTRVALRSIAPRTRRRPHLCDFGQHGPLRDRQATPLTDAGGLGLGQRARSGPAPGTGRRTDRGVRRRGLRRSWCAHRVEERAPSDDGDVVEVDVSVMESLLSTLPYPMLMAEQMRKLGLPPQHKCRPGDGHRPRRGRLARNQLSDGSALAGRLRDARPAGIRRASDRGHAGRPRARRVLREGPALAVWSERSTRSSNSARRLRIPATPVNDGATVLECPQYRDRGFFVDAGGDGWSFQRPGAPFRLSRTPVLPVRPAPRLGETAQAVSAQLSRTSRCPLAQILRHAVRGLESSRPVAHSGRAPTSPAISARSAPTSPRSNRSNALTGFATRGHTPTRATVWYERSGMWQATNLNKRDITLDLDLRRRVVI